MKKLVLLTACIGLCFIGGCSGDSSSSQSASSTASSVDGSKYLLSSKPDGANDVIAVREQAKDGDEVVIVGRIGGSESPMVEGRAAFSIVDLSLESCLDCGSEGCPKPWDYC